MGHKWILVLGKGFSICRNCDLKMRRRRRQRNNFAGVPGGPFFTEYKIDGKWQQVSEVPTCKNALGKSVMPKHSLEECPCCGTKTAYLQMDSKVFAGQNYGDRYPAPVNIQSHGYQVRCQLCGLQTCWWHYKQEAVDAWNTRNSK